MQIDRSAPGWDFIIFALPIPFAWQVEQFTHRICAPFRVRFWGSGRTERFFIIAAIPAIALSLLVFAFSWGSAAILFFAIVKSLL